MLRSTGIRWECLSFPRYAILEYLNNTTLDQVLELWVWHGYVRTRRWTLDITVFPLHHSAQLNTTAPVKPTKGLLVTAVESELYPRPGAADEECHGLATWSSFKSVTQKWKNSFQRNWSHQQPRVPEFHLGISTGFSLTSRLRRKYVKALFLEK